MIAADSRFIDAVSDLAMVWGMNSNVHEPIIGKVTPVIELCWLDVSVLTVVAQRLIANAIPDELKRVGGLPFARGYAVDYFDPDITSIVLVEYMPVVSGVPLGPIRVDESCVTLVLSGGYTESSTSGQCPRSAGDILCFPRYFWYGVSNIKVGTLQLTVSF